MTRWRLLFTVVGVGVTLHAHDVISTKITWSREVSRIVYKRCASCHRDGGSAFSLINYDEARPWAKAIKEEVLSRRMPPWNAVKGFAEFKNDAGLTQEELEIIADWVEGGAPEGNPLYMPSKPRARKSVESKNAGDSVRVAGSLVLKAPAEFTGIQPGTLQPGSVVQVVAQRPDGVVDPLLWVQNFNPAYNQPYVFANPVSLPAGTRISVTPASAPAVVLYRASDK